MPKSRLPVIFSAVLAALIFATFAPVLWYQFVSLDDFEYVTDNEQVLAGLTLDGVRWAFRSVSTGNWHPLTWLSHMVDCEVFSLAPGGHHFTSLLIHIANAILLFFVLRQMTRSDWKSAIVAAIFGVHPLHVESVVWISERKDLLSTFFGLLSVSAYARYVQGDKLNVSHRWGCFALALVFFACSLMSKSMLVTLPFLLLLLDFWPLRRTRYSEGKDIALGQSEAAGNGIAPIRPLSRLVLEKLPFLALTLAVCAVTYVVQKHAGAMKLMDSRPIVLRLANALISYCRYLSNTFWPSGLTAFYPYPKFWPVGYVAVAALFLMVVTTTVVYFARLRPYLSVGWFWFVGTLIPVIGIVQVGGQSMADRYMYVPLVGVLLIVVWSTGEVVSRNRGLQRSFSVMALLSVVVCAVLTGRQISYWKNSRALYDRMIAVTSDNIMAESSLAMLDLNAGNYESALHHLQRMRELKPDYGEGLNNLGFLLVTTKGNVEEGVRCYREAIQADLISRKCASTWDWRWLLRKIGRAQRVNSSARWKEDLN
jgi:hypothetical protein